MFATSSIAASLIAESTISRNQPRLQPRFFGNPASPDAGRVLSWFPVAELLHLNLCRFISEHRPKDSRFRAATDSRDENLKAKSPAAAGGSKEERKRERLSERSVVSLTRPTPPHNRKGSHRAVTAMSRMARNSTISGWKI